MNMDTDQMLTFVTLARERNFHRTAKLLNISQPTVTIRLKVLEQNLGALLIRRQGNVLSLTAYGEVVLDYIERMLRMIQKGKDQMSNLTETKRTLSIAGIDSFCTYVFPQMLAVDRQVNNNITLFNGRSAEVLQSVIDGVSQFGVLRGPVHHPAVDSVLIYSEKILLALPVGHPLQQYDELSIKQLLNENFITYSRRFWSFLHTHFMEQGESLKSKIRVDGEVTAKKLVMSGLGISFLPELSIRKEFREKKLIARFLQDCHLCRDAYLIFPKGCDEKLTGDFYSWVERSISESAVVKSTKTTKKFIG